MDKKAINKILVITIIVVSVLSIAYKVLAASSGQAIDIYGSKGQHKVPEYQQLIDGYGDGDSKDFIENYGIIHRKGGNDFELPDDAHSDLGTDAFRG